VITGADETCGYSIGDAACKKSTRPQVSFVDFESPNLAAPPSLLTVKGKLSLPVRFDWRKRCFVAEEHSPAVVILHATSGVDSRADFSISVCSGSHGVAW